MRMTTALGWNVGANGSNITLNTGSANLAAVSFVALGATVSDIYVPITGVGGGGVPAGYLRCRIVPEDTANNFLPNMSTVIATATNDADITAAGQYAHFSFSSHTLTPGTRYWAVLDNTHGTGTVTVTPTDYNRFHGTTYQWAVATYSTSWAYSGGARRLGESVHFTNGLVWGAALQAYGLSDLLSVYGTSRMSGLKVTTGDIGYRLAGLAFYGSRYGSGCTISYAVYQGSTLMAETYTMVGAWESGSNPRFLAFPSVVELQPNTTYRLVLRNPNGDGTSSNYYKLATPVSARTSADAQRVWGGLGFAGCVYTETTDGGTTWTDDTQFRYPRAFIMVLDETQPFIVPSGGGGSPIINPFQIIT